MRIAQCPHHILNFYVEKTETSIYALSMFTNFIDDWGHQSDKQIIKHGYTFIEIVIFFQMSKDFAEMQDEEDELVMDTSSLITSALGGEIQTAGNNSSSTSGNKTSLLAFPGFNSMIWSNNRVRIVMKHNVEVTV